MNEVRLRGRLHGPPLKAETTGGIAVATVHLLPAEIPPHRCGADGCQGIPCVIDASQLPELLAWDGQGCLLDVTGHLVRVVLWYDEHGGRCALQVRVERVTPIPPAATAAPPAAEADGRSVGANDGSVP
jgi:hypothetical protein